MVDTLTMQPCDLARYGTRSLVRWKTDLKYRIYCNIINIKSAITWWPNDYRIDGVMVNSPDWNAEGYRVECR